MSAGGGRVITTLRDRRQIEHEIREMLKVHAEKELSSRARRVAASGAQVIPVILDHLDHSDPRMLGALGVIAAQYPRREQILNKLYQAAADPERQDRERVSAMLILEKFLEQEPDPYLIGSLQDPQVMVNESIKEMLLEGEQDPSVLVAYAHALATQPEETVLSVVDALVEVGQARAVPILCLLAQEQSDEVARIALVGLGRLRHPKALRGLQSITPMLPPARRLWSERSLRKLQFAEVPITPLSPVDDGWRALVGPVDGEGTQVVWFIRDPGERNDCYFLGLTISESEGIQRAYGSPSVPAAMLPERHPLGQVHRVPFGWGWFSLSESASLQQQESSDLYMLETDFDFGRRLVREGQALNFELGRPLPAEYRLLGLWLWRYDDVQEDAAYRPPALPAFPRDALAETVRLLSYPGLRGWFARGDRVLQYAVVMRQVMPVVFQEGLRGWAAELATEYFDEAMIERVRDRLARVGEWFGRAGETRLEELAAIAAATVDTVGPAEHPFTRHMAERGLRASTDQLERQKESDKQKEC